MNCYLQNEAFVEDGNTEPSGPVQVNSPGEEDTIELSPKEHGGKEIIELNPMTGAEEDGSIEDFDVAELNTKKCWRLKI